MLRKIAAGASAAVVAAGLAAAPAAATGFPGSPADPCSDVAQTERQGPCVTVVPFSAVKRNSGPPAVGTPTPEVPSSPPSDGSGPGPGDTAPPPASPPPSPPLESAGPPPAPDITPVPAPAPVEPAPTPTPAPAEPRKPSEAVLPTAEPRLPQTATDTRPLTVAGGCSLIAAGFAWIGGARRRRKRPAGVMSG